jgi:hypothetical protein
MSENLQRRIDEAVKQLSEQAYEVALSQIRENREAIDKIVEVLMEKETIGGNDFRAMLSGAGTACRSGWGDGKMSGQGAVGPLQELDQGFPAVFAVLAAVFASRTIECTIGSPVESMLHAAASLPCFNTFTVCLHARRVHHHPRGEP